MIKTILRGTLQIIRDTDGFFTWATTCWHKKTTLEGTCKQRGICCKNIAVGVSNTINNNRFLMHIANWWYTFVYNFNLKGWYKNDKILIYSCNYLKNGKCSIYWRRPLICRQYPHHQRIGNTTMPGCGYTVKKPTPLNENDTLNV
jgi:hypothetical protein